MNKMYVVIVLVIVLVSGGLYVLVTGNPHPAVTTYFTYSKEDVASLKGLSSKATLTTDDLYRWDKIAFDTVSLEKRADIGGKAAKLNAYLAVAQRDFAFLSYTVSGSFSGNMDALSREIVCNFLQSFCAQVPPAAIPDTYSTALGKLVLEKVKARMQEDAAGQKDYSIKTGKEYWDGPQPSTGIADGSNTTWFLSSGSQFRAPPPPAVYGSEAFKQQLQITEDALKNATPAQKRATVFWAGVPGTKTPIGQILDMGDTYMKEQGTPFRKAALVRSVLAMGIADAVTAVFDSKYTYLVRRPFMMDPSIVTIMPTPNHPSYPAGHSTLSTTGAIILSYYFPEAKDMWEAKTYEAGMSRIWGGIHYLMDHEAGVTLGDRVGATAIGAPSSRE